MLLLLLLLLLLFYYYYLPLLTKLDGLAVTTVERKYAAFRVRVL